MEKNLKISKILLGFIIGGFVFFKTLFPAALTSDLDFLNVSTVELMTMVYCATSILWLLFFKTLTDYCGKESEVGKWSSYGKMGALFFIIYYGIQFTTNLVNSINSATYFGIPDALASTLGIGMGGDLQTVLDIAGGVLMALAFFKLSNQMKAGSNIKAAALALAIAGIAVTVFSVIWSKAPFLNAFILAKTGISIWFLFSYISNRPFEKSDAAVVTPAE